MTPRPAKTVEPFPPGPGQPASAEAAVLGAAAVDWVARVEKFPPIDGIAFTDHYQPYPGGSGGNVAEGIARLGHSVRFLGALGDDDGGTLLLGAFKQAGVDTSCVHIRKGERSAACFIAVDAEAQRLIFSLGGAALFDRLEDVEPGQFAGIKILFIADAFPQVAARAISMLSPGCKVIFNPGGLMCSYGAEALQPILEKTDLLITSRGEAEVLTKLPDPQDAAKALARLGPPSIVITLGKEGALVLDEQRFEQIQAIPVDDPVDTTGAGDVFSAGVVCGLLEGMTTAQAARLGCEVAAHKIRHTGARAGLPERKQVLSLK